MHVLTFGATERIGAAVVEYALAAGHQVTAFLPPRTALRLQHLNLARAEGEITKLESLVIPMLSSVDAVVNAIGSDFSVPLSGAAAESTRVILGAMRQYGGSRYLGVTACTRLPATGWLGRVTQQILKWSPLRKAILDHERAASLVAASALEWTLVAVPSLVAGQHTGEYRVSRDGFPGGCKRISHQDAADFLVKELVRKRHLKQVVGIWY
jgi:putative NADH-flavin reductase